MRLTSADLPTFGRPTIASTGQRGKVGDALRTLGRVLEEFEVFVVELVLGEARAQRAGALLGDLVVERVETLGEFRVELGLEFVVLARGNGDAAVAHDALSSVKSWRFTRSTTA